MQRFNKQLREAKQKINNELNFQYFYRSIKASKLTGRILFLSFTIVGIAIFKLSGGLSEIGKEKLDDSNDDNVLNEAKILLQQKQDDIRHKK